MGNSLATEPLVMNVMAVNGLFSVTIDDAALPGALYASTTGQAWLELTVGNDTFPRQQVTATVFALKSASADVAQSVSCTGCIVNAQIAAGTIDSSKLAQVPGGKVTPPSGAYFFNDDGAIHTIAYTTINAPGPGVILAASSGWLEMYTHTTGTQDVVDCCLDTGLNCNSNSLAIEEFQVPSAWPTVPGGTVNADMSFPTVLIGTLPVSAAGPVLVNLNCIRYVGDMNGGNVHNARVQLFYMPGQY
jgi:hypothetical protein